MRRTIETEPDDCHYERYEVTPAELFEMVHRPPENWQNARTWSDMVAGDRHYTVKWRGATSEELLSMRDWPKGRALFGQYRSDLVRLPEIQNIKRVRVWREDGDDFSRDRLDAGHADCWESRRRQRVNGPNASVIRVTSTIGGSAGLTAEELSWTGAAAALLVDKLEAAGYRVELDALYTGSHVRCVNAPDCVRNVQHWTIPLKAADEPLDIDRVLLVLAHPGFFRFHWFRAALDLDSECTARLGTVCDAIQRERGEIHFERCITRESAEREIVRAVERFMSAKA